MQEIGYNEKQIAQAESKIKEYEQELALLWDMIAKEGYIKWRSASSQRAGYIEAKLMNAERTVERLEQTNSRLKKTLSN
jgi:hypothetical protein